MIKIKKYIKFIIPFLVLFFNFLIILFPKEFIQGSKDGLLIWFNNVLPSLLPFIICTNILIKSGFISFLGTISAPFMGKLLRLKGEGIFPVLCGFLSGYPMGVKIICQMYEEKILDKEDCNHLLSFCSNAGPLFVIGVVGLNMYSNEKIGYYILTVNYTASFIIGFLLSLKKEKHRIYYKKPVFNYNLGKVLSESIENSMESIVIIGGYIIFFSVFLKIFYVLNFPTILKETMICLTEVTKGCEYISTKGINRINLSLLSFITSFSGFCINAQCSCFISKAGLDTKKYFISKMFQSCLSFFVSLILYPYFFE